VLDEGLAAWAVAPLVGGVVGPRPEQFGAAARPSAQPAATATARPSVARATVISRALPAAP
jgi:hypothetical protein